MKNKKLFAILTLVCFMFTLMPVAAFAATADPVDDAAVLVSATVDGTYADELDDVETGKTFYAAVDVDGVTTTSNYVFYAVDEDGDGVAINNDGIFTIKAEGDYKVYAVYDASSKTNSLLNDVDTVANKVADLIAWADSYDLIVEEYAEVSVEDGDYTYSISFKEGEDNKAFNFDPATNTLYITASEGWDEDGNVVAVLESSNGGSVKAKDLTFSTAGYVDVTLEDGETTDKKGEVAFEVTSDYAGEYKVIVKYGKEAKATLTVISTSADAADVEVYSAPTAPFNKGSEVESADIEFKFVDAAGAAYTGVAVDAKITVVDQPADSDMEAKDFVLVPDADGVDGVWTLAGENGKKFEEEGEYTFKVALKNGASATVNVEVAEMGDVVAIKFYKAPITVVYGATTQVAQGITLVDANGVTDTLLVGPKYLSDEDEKDNKINPDYGKVDGVEFSVTGKAVKSLNNTFLAIDDEEDYIGTTVTVYAVYDDEFVASTTMTVTDAAAQIIYKDKTAEVAVNNVIYGTVLDGEGKYVTLNGVKANAIVLDAPEDAVAVATVEYTTKKGVMLNLLASEAGEYEIQTVITYTDAAGVSRYLTSIDTFTVGAGNQTFSDVVVMSIGANNIVVNSDVKAIAAAPMIQDGRTFVPFRALAEAFGADVEWVEATQSVVAELNGVKVVMVIGEEAYTVNGVAKTADVAPFINGASTMVPVRFVAEAFGINVTPIYAENGAVADVLFAK